MSSGATLSYTGGTVKADINLATELTTETDRPNVKPNVVNSF